MRWKSLAGSTAEVSKSGSWKCDFDWCEEGFDPGSLRDIRVDGPDEAWMFIGNDDEEFQVRMYPEAVADAMIGSTIMEPKKVREWQEKSKRIQSGLSVIHVP